MERHGNALGKRGVGVELIRLRQQESAND